MSDVATPALAFDGKVALVTGGSSGIGRATVLAFAHAGTRVVVADIDEPGGQETVRLVTEAGGQAVFVRTDVSREADVEAVIRCAVATYGRLDCAHNNAGIEGTFSRLADCTAEDWARTIAVDLTGVWLCMKHEIRHMVEQGGGAIVNTSSVAGLKSGRSGPDYVASKHGVIGLTRKAAVDYASVGIRVNAVCPGIIRTPMAERLFEQRPELEGIWMGMQPTGRLGTSEEVAAAVVWLCSDAAAFVTGLAMPVDGGMLA